ncbi:MAG TPA: hypothetical protein VKV04_07340 [Verrucomicrobiae bacterium]|nr:hypothetical protein [Verrucomicrobiae bacterium]
MKVFRLIPLLFLSACSSTPNYSLYPQQPAPRNDDSGLRYPEVIRAYHFGRYIDPNDGLVMHEQHAVYRVEENTRWDLHTGAASGGAIVQFGLPRDTAFNPSPLNDAVLAEVNAQKMATARIVLEAKTLSTTLSQFESAFQQTKTNLQQTAVLRAAIIEMNQRLNALEKPPVPVNSSTNEPPDALDP